MPTQSEQKSCPHTPTFKTSGERNSLEEAAEMAHSLSQITRADRSYYPLRRELSTALNALFTDEHRNTALSNAPGGRDPAGHAVRYLRSVSWHEVFILLSEGKIAFPRLHKNLEHQLSDEHGARFLRMIEASTSGLNNYCHEMRASKRFPHYLEAMYLIAASVPLDEVLNQHAAGRGGGQVFSPFLSTTTGGPMMDPVSHGVSIEVVVPFPRAFPNWGNFARIEQESLLTELHREDVTRIYFSEETLMDDLLAPGSQLQEILPQQFIERSHPGSPFTRHSNYAITCWRTCEREALLPETWQKESDIQRNREYLRAQYRQWGTRGLSELSKGRIVPLSDFFKENSCQS